MDRNSGGRVDGETMHRLVAGRVGRRPRGIDWRETRDLSLVLTLATFAPVAALAMKLGVSPTLTLASTAVTAVAAGWIVRVLGREYALELTAGPLASVFTLSRPRALSHRCREVAIRLIPARHQTATGPASVGASAVGPRSRSARPRRRNPGA